ncbi:MAG: penicillin acylase family protein [Candidatus Dormibacteraeota bacterium]|nr:penicillin acylase family protein [Candidatus Dormibacteraeota bacterium]
MVRRSGALANAILATVVCGGLLYAGTSGVGPLTGVGPLLDPATGFWTAGPDAALPHDQTLQLTGLHAQASVTFDALGVPHIRARDDHDLFLALGYVHARYRLFEMDLIRRQGEGRLAQVLGSKLLPVDEFELDLGLSRTAQEDLKRLAPDERAVLQAYADGVNARIREAKTERNLPAFFKLLGYEPADWQLLDTAVIKGIQAQDLAYQTNPLTNARLVKALGADRASQWFPVLPASNRDTPYDPGPYQTAAAAPLPAAVVGDGADAAAASLLSRTAGLPKFAAETGASNNWAVDGTLTASGKPLMANDPHLALNLPSVWFQVDLESPSYHVRGVTFPGAPVVPIGRNEQISWGATDTQNQATLYYAEKTDPAHPDQYFWQGAWHRMERISYDIPVKGGSTEHHELKLTVHGPILTQQGQTLAVEWMGNVPSSGLGSILRMMRAGDWPGFKAALKDWTSPTQNWVYADAAGHIGIYAPGLYPIVKAARPDLPLPGTGEADVVGTVPLEQVPQVYDPPGHMVVSANQRPVGGDYPYYVGTSQDDFDPGYRAAEIRTALRSLKGPLTVLDVQRIQLDDRDQLAVRVLPLLLGAVGEADLDPLHRQALAEIRGWDGVMRASSPAAGIWDAFWREYLSQTFQPWWNHYRVGVPITEVAGPLGAALEGWTLSGAPTDAFSPPGSVSATPDLVMATAFGKAVSSLARRFGSRPETWAWSRVHQRLIASLIDTSLSYGPRGAGGDERTPDAAAGTVSTHGPSWRMVVDWGSGRSYGVYPAGQAENPVSAWYENLVDDWWAGRYHEMTTAAEAESRSGSATWTLQP